MNRTLFRVLLVLLAPGFLLRLHAQPALPRTALVMGVWSYQDPTFSALPGIENDVKKMSAKLSELGFQVTTVTNPTLKEAREAVDKFAALLKTRKGVGCFYYSGHGCEHEGKNFLIPKGTHILRRADLDDQALSASRILSGMEASGGKVNIVFLDCCRNSMSKGSEGLAPMQANGTFIGFATGSAKEAGATGTGSVYTQALLENMGVPGITLDSMHNRVTKRVKELTHGEQNPFKYSGLDQDFVLARRAGSAASGQSPPSTPPPVPGASIPSAPAKTPLPGAKVPSVSTAKGDALRALEKSGKIREDLNKECSKEDAQFIDHTINAAINRGSPLYNSGQIMECYLIYEEAAGKILQKIHSKAAGNLLNTALERAHQTNKPGEKAWIMRNALDAMSGVHGQGG